MTRRRHRCTEATLVEVTPTMAEIAAEWHARLNVCPAPGQGSGTSDPTAPTAAWSVQESGASLNTEG